MIDKSNGYEEIAMTFVHLRGKSVLGIGSSSVRSWSRTLPPNSTILELGCGTGLPISRVLIDEGMNVYGVDASPAMIRIFQQNFPGVPVACEAVEESLFFNRKFDGIVAWGLVFLLSEEVQKEVLRKAAGVLNVGGKLLFTAPSQKTEWKDIMTGQRSTSLGAEMYKKLLSASGLSLVEEFEDEGENHYYNAVKI